MTHTRTLMAVYALLVLLVPSGAHADQSASFQLLTTFPNEATQNTAASPDFQTNDAGISWHGYPATGTNFQVIHPTTVIAAESTPGTQPPEDGGTGGGGGGGEGIPPSGGHRGANDPGIEPPEHGGASSARHSQPPTRPGHVPAPRVFPLTGQLQGSIPAAGTSRAENIPLRFFNAVGNCDESTPYHAAASDTQSLLDASWAIVERYLLAVTALVTVLIACSGLVRWFPRLRWLKNQSSGSISLLPIFLMFEKRKKHGQKHRHGRHHRRGVHRRHQ